MRSNIEWKIDDIHTHLNSRGCFRCPLDLLVEVFTKAGGSSSSLIPFRKSYNSDGHRTYGTPWDTLIYEQFESSATFGNVVLMDFFADGSTLAKSATKSVIFIRVRFPNVRGYSEKRFDTDIAPNQKTFPEYMSEDRKPRAKSLP